MWNNNKGDYTLRTSRMTPQEEAEYRRDCREERTAMQMLGLLLVWTTLGFVGGCAFTVYLFYHLHR